jgi:hypothetical protein
MLLCPGTGTLRRKAAGQHLPAANLSNPNPLRDTPTTGAYGEFV